MRAADGPPVVDLDPRYYRLIGDLNARFPHGAPSLIACRRFSVRGDVRFGAAVEARGDVALQHDQPEPLIIPDNAILPASVG